MSRAQRARDWSKHPRGGCHAGARAVEIDGVRYPSVTDAAGALGVAKRTAIVRIKRGLGRYLDDHNSIQTTPWSDKPGRQKAVIIDGAAFRSHTEASAHFGVTSSLIQHWIKKGRAYSVAAEYSALLPTAGPV